MFCVWMLRRISHSHKITGLFSAESLLVTRAVTLLSKHTAMCVSLTVALSDTPYRESPPVGF